jgi:hypothetical protein
MDRPRYEAYVATRDAIADQAVDEFAAQVLEDAAEALLLARNTSEADSARAMVPEALGLLVERGDLTPEAAEWFWAHLKGCGPSMLWPSSWTSSPASSRTWVARGH